MRFALTLATAALVTMSGVQLASSAPVPTPEADDAGAAACVKWRGEARPTGYGYKHVVIIENGCKKPAVCDVSTDVNPQVQTVTVAPASKEEVVTFFEAPASGFTPNVSCKLK